MTSNRNGFTLVELVIVLTLAGLIVAIAMPRTDTPGRRLTGAVREGWATLMGARQQAVLLQHDVYVDFDSAGGTLTVTQDADNDGEQDDGERVTTLVLEGVLIGRGAAPAGVTGPAAVSFAAPAGGTQPRVVFHRSGSASAFGGFYLRTDRAESAARADEVRLLTVERATGRVSAFHPVQSRWERTF